MDPAQIAFVIEVLESARRRKPMYLAPVSVDSAVHLLYGFNLAFFTMGLQISHATRQQAYIRHGWRYTALGVWETMRKKGMSEEAIVDELFALEIEAWKIRLEQIPQSSQ